MGAATLSAQARSYFADTTDYLSLALAELEYQATRDARRRERRAFTSKETIVEGVTT